MILNGSKNKAQMPQVATVILQFQSRPVFIKACDDNSTGINQRDTIPEDPS